VLGAASHSAPRRRFRPHCIAHSPAPHRAPAHIAARSAGGGTGGQVAKDALGNDVKVGAAA
jgi:hypothetical protein